MKHYLVTFRNNNVGDIKLVGDNLEKIKADARYWAKLLHPTTRIMIKDVWLCTKINPTT